MGRGLGSKSSSKWRVAEGDAEPVEEEEEGSSDEYEVDVVRDHIASSCGSRLALFGSDLRLGRFRPRRRRRRPLAGEGAAEGFFHDLVIHPDNKYAIAAPLLLLSPQSRPASARALPVACSGSCMARLIAWPPPNGSDGSHGSLELTDQDQKNPIFMDTILSFCWILPATNFLGGESPGIFIFQVFGLIDRFDAYVRLADYHYATGCS